MDTIGDSSESTKMPELKLNYPMFSDFIEPKGFLTFDRRSHAAWWYFVLASKSRHVAGRGPEDQIIETEDGLQTPLWMERRYHQIATSVALVYQLESPDEFIPFFDLVIKQAESMGTQVRPDLLKPFGVGRLQ